MVGVLNLPITDESFKWYGPSLSTASVSVDSESTWVNMTETVAPDSPNNSLVELVSSPRGRHQKLKWFSKKRLMGKRVFSEIYKDTGEDVMRGSPRDGTVAPQGTVCFMSENPYRICKVRPNTPPPSSTLCIVWFVIWKRHFWFLDSFVWTFI